MADFTKLNNTLTIDEIIGNHQKQDPQALAVKLFKRGVWISYSREEFWNKVEYWSDIFTRILTPNSLILFIKKLDIDLLTAYLGAIRAGVIPAQINFYSKKTNLKEYKEKLEHIINITKAGAIFTDEEAEALDNLTKDTTIVTPGFKLSADKLKYLKQEHIVDNNKSKIALVQFSSGSTGMQKGVRLTHRAIINHMNSYSKSLQITDNDSIVSWLPLYHDMGLIACYLMPLLKGLPIYQMDPFDWILNPNLLLDTIEKFKATICFLPNFSYHVLANKCKEYDLSSIKYFVNCSEPAKDYSHKIFLDKFKTVSEDRLTVCYALAENIFAVSQSLPSDKAEIIDNVVSCGKPIDNVTVKIFDSNSKGEGLIGIKSPFLFESFTDNTKQLREGFYLTGDTGFIKDEYIYVTGREKDLIIINGKNLYPQDLEFIASNVTGVYPGRVVCFGIENELIGSEEIYVIVEPIDTELENYSILRQKIQKAIYNDIGMLPKKVEIVPYMTLLKTSSGKISRSKNKTLYLNKEFKLL